MLEDETGRDNYLRELLINIRIIICLRLKVQLHIPPLGARRPIGKDVTTADIYHGGSRGGAGVPFSLVCFGGDLCLSQLLGGNGPLN